MENLPAVSALCVTYGRPHLLEEALYSFLNQDYKGQKEFIILNDFAEQQLVFDHPEVKVINVPYRFRTLGEKRNASAALASHDVLMVWDDDDIYLPHRISQSVERLKSEGEYVKQGPNAPVMSDGVITKMLEGSILHSSSCFTRQLFEKIGGYRLVNLKEDLFFEQDVEAQIGNGFYKGLQNPSDYFYLYRWGTASYHISWYGNKSEAEVTGEIANYVNTQLKENKIQTGVINLNPNWKQDYVKLMSDFLS